MSGMTDHEELRVSNDAMDDAVELQRRIAEEGYLFFRRLHDPDKLQALRREMMSAVQEAGWLVAGTDPSDGIADVGKQCTEGDRSYSDGYGRAYRLESFHRSAHWPEIMDMVEKIVGKPIMPHPQKVARIWFPQYTDHTTPTHQDFVHFQGSFDTLTCWAPVGDCPVELGGLAVIPGSHKVDRVLDHHFSLGAGGLVVDETAHEEIDPVWHSTDYEMGDTLIFPALTVHKALPNYTGDQLRLSLDNRYQAVGDSIAEHMLEPHGPSGLSWDQIYPDWSGDDLKHYWKSYDNPVVPRDMSFSDRGFAEALELARGGNEHAVFRMQRTVANDPDSAYGQQARAMLAEVGLA